VRARAHGVGAHAATADLAGRQGAPAERPRLPPVERRRCLAALALVAGLAVATACEAGPAPATPPVTPAAPDRPREVNVILKDWLFVPDPVDVVPGETVLLHVVNGGLEIHELVIGDAAVQAAWEAAEAAAADPPPGPTPVVTVPAERAGLRVVVPSGQRVDVTWTVPDAPAGVERLLLGCHIPGHWAKGMRATLRVVPGGG
jgi:uncharacterized cupredoxin-like copper-binding protein